MLKNSLKMKNNIIYSVLSSSLLFMSCISLLSLQNNDIKIPQEEATITLDLRYKFNMNLAVKDNKTSLSSN